MSEQPNPLDRAAEEKRTREQGERDASALLRENKAAAQRLWEQPIKMGIDDVAEMFQDRDLTFTRLSRSASATLNRFETDLDLELGNGGKRRLTVRLSYGGPAVQPALLDRDRGETVLPFPDLADLNKNTVAQAILDAYGG